MDRPHIPANVIAEGQRLERDRRLNLVAAGAAAGVMDALEETAWVGAHMRALGPHVLEDMYHHLLKVIRDELSLWEGAE